MDSFRGNIEASVRGLTPWGVKAMSEVSTIHDPQTQLSAAENPDLADASILLVDDNLQNLELMQAYLESLPCRIRTARDGVEAVAMVDQECPDLVLLDVMMP